MSAYRLRTFEPPADPAVPRLGPREVEAVRDAALREGFLSGQAQAMEAHLDDQSRLTAALVEAVDDAAMTHEAARRHAAASLAPMLEALVAVLTPALAEAGLAAEIARRVELALAAAPECRPRLRCAPELAGTMRGVFADRGLAAEVEVSPDLLPREAQLHWDHGYDRIDLEACAADLRACIASHLEEARGESDDDRRRYG
jgi:hypothetical protein